MGRAIRRELPLGRKAPHPGPDGGDVPAPGVPAAASRRPSSPRPGSTGLVSILAVCLGLAALPAAGDVERTEEGIHIRTGPKAVQSQLDGLRLDDPGRTAAARSRTGRTVRGGRLLRAGPIEDVSVGIVGCPGCTVLLQAVGGVFLDLDRGRWYRGDRNRRPGDGRRGFPRRPRGHEHPGSGRFPR